MISDQGSKELGTVLLYVVVPSVVIKTFCIEYTAEKASQLAQSLLFSVLAMAAAVIISWAVFGLKKGISCFSSTFSNAAFIGIPLITGTIGSQAIFYISMIIVLVNLLQWTLGVYMITKDPSSMSLKKIVTNPIVIAVALGMIIFFGRIPVPELVLNTLNTVTGMNTPLAMILSGIYLAQADIRKMVSRTDNYLVSLMRLAVIPLVTMLVMKVIPLGSLDMKLAILIAAAAPVGSNVAIFARQYNKDHTLAIEQVCMSTVLCIASLPLIVMAAIILLG
ncbi:MAG: AEC family transporter [Solobacterium sp.]|nr:AEC family transporter [Solobacterium sp.]